MIIEIETRSGGRLCLNLATVETFVASGTFETTLRFVSGAETTIDVDYRVVAQAAVAKEAGSTFVDPTDFLG